MSLELTQQQQRALDPTDDTADRLPKEIERVCTDRPLMADGAEEGTTSAAPAATIPRIRSAHSPAARYGASTCTRPVRSPMRAWTSTSCAMLAVVPPPCRKSVAMITS